MSAYNASQTGGVKSLLEIRTKYKNLKALERKTGEGSFFEERYDDDGAQRETWNNSSCPMVVETNGGVQVFAESIGSSASTSNKKTVFNNTRNKKMAKHWKKKTKPDFKPDISDLKAEAMRLDNEYKRLKIKKIRIEISQMLGGEQWDDGSDSSDSSDD